MRPKGSSYSRFHFPPGFYNLIFERLNVALNICFHGRYKDLYVTLLHHFYTFGHLNCRFTYQSQSNVCLGNIQKCRPKRSAFRMSKGVKIESLFISTPLQSPKQKILSLTLLSLYYSTTLLLSRKYVFLYAILFHFRSLVTYQQTSV